MSRTAGDFENCVASLASVDASPWKRLTVAPSIFFRSQAANSADLRRVVPAVFADERFDTSLRLAKSPPIRTLSGVRTRWRGSSAMLWEVDIYPAAGQPDRAGAARGGRGGRAWAWPADLRVAAARGYLIQGDARSQRRSSGSPANCWPIASSSGTVVGRAWAIAGSSMRGRRLDGAGGWQWSTCCPSRA